VTQITKGVGCSLHGLWSLRLTRGTISELTIKHADDDQQLEGYTMYYNCKISAGAQVRLDVIAD
jgi:hypothetical protein